MMVRATVFLLLALVGSVMLTQTVATRNIYDDLSAVPTCQADYAKMDPEFPKLLLNEPFLYYSAGVCTNPKNGDFVIGYWQPRPYVFLHDNFGWIKKRMDLPAGTSYSTGYAFSGSKIFYAATQSRELLQFNEEGIFEKVFATAWV